MNVFETLLGRPEKVPSFGKNEMAVIDYFKLLERKEVVQVGGLVLCLEAFEIPPGFEFGVIAYGSVLKPFGQRVQDIDLRIIISPQNTNNDPLLVSPQVQELCEGVEAVRQYIWKYFNARNIPFEYFCKTTHRAQAQGASVDRTGRKNVTFFYSDKYNSDPSFLTLEDLPLHVTISQAGKETWASHLAWERKTVQPFSVITHRNGPR